MSKRTQHLVGEKEIPMYFIPNQGQWKDENVHYYAHGKGYEVFFTDQGASFVFLEREKEKGLRLDFHFLNDHHAIVPSVRRELPGRVNYYRGADAKKWLTGIPTFEEVMYLDVWPGIDLHFYGKEGQLKYEFIVHPGASVERIKFTYKGMDEIALDEEGNIVLQTVMGEMVDKRPVSLQENGREQELIQTRFTLLEDAANGPTFGFFLEENYDSQRNLLIDPGLIYSSYLGGAEQDQGINIAVDSSGNAYVTGITASTDFPTKNAFQGVNGGRFDAFVTKVDPAGSLVFSSYLGGANSDFGLHIATDLSGNAYVSGNTSSTNFPTLNAFQGTFGGVQDAFITKVDPAGALIYSSYLGGSVSDSVSGLTTDSGGNVYVTGETSSTDFPTQNAFQGVYGGNVDAFVTKVDPTGSLVYSSYLGGTGREQAQGIAIDSSGNAYVTGSTGSINFPTQNAFQGTYQGVQDAFVTKINPTGSLIYSSYLGGTGQDDGSSIATDSSGNAYVTGLTFSNDFPTQNAFQGTYGGAKDAFVTKVDPTGSLIYSSYLGGAGQDEGSSIATDSSGNAYVMGFTTSSNFPTFNAFQGTYGGNDDIFITKVDQTGSLVYSSYLGGSEQDSGSSIAIDPSGNTYVTGYTQSTDFPTQNAFQGTFGGILDVIVTKIDSAGTLVYSSYLGGAGQDIGFGIAIDSNGNAYVTGFTDSTNFPTQSAFQSVFGGAFDGFVTKIGLVCSDDITVDNDPGECGAVVQYTSSPGAECSPPSGSFFPVGETVVTCSEGDQTCFFTVTVQDTEPPVISCSNSITVFVSSNESGTTVTYPDPVVTDNCPGSTFTCSPASGSFFPIGTTAVTCTAMDEAGNTSSCSFDVVVLQQQPERLNTECIHTLKVYDWIIYQNKNKGKYMIPDPACQRAVSNALENGELVTVKCTPPTPDQIQCMVSILEHGTPGKLLITWTIPVDVTIFILEESICSFTVRTQVQDEVMVCIPEGITVENIKCSARQILCHTEDVLMGSDPLGPMIPLSVMVCKEIEVTFPVNLEVFGTFCFPRRIN
ncbi:SBBP repeat-containing protein [Rossellomorea aquimaris]|uniref:SBBP repeat-containing protein n=1 Tax=Rossellomorea aquimaris TaxID=189382 RepID=UPI001CFCD3F3|nr:SBBP repeat-containing protein [Rossellomorea aquimaris]